MIWKNIGFFFALFIILLSSFLVQYSVSMSSGLLIFNKHIFFFILCIPLSVLIILLPIEKIIFFNKFIYYVNLLVLFITLIIGKTTMGATRWLNLAGLTFQPAEFMKISIILMLSSYFYKANESSIKKLSYFFIPTIYLSLPVILILLQPNLGTSIIIILISLSIILIVFSKLEILWIPLTIILISGPFIWEFGLHSYQRQRVLTFIDPERDSKGKGYNIIQSKIAIGSGGLFGAGYMNGTQNKLQFLPEQHNDFIFSVFAEEFGFIGTIFLILMYFIIILYTIQLAIRTENLVHKLIIIGCNSMIFWHTIVNTFMTMDLIPVVGVPLPFLSYGRSFFLSSIICISLIINLMRRNSKQRIDVQNEDYKILIRN